MYLGGDFCFAGFFIMLCVVHVCMEWKAFKYIFLIFALFHVDDFHMKV